MPVKKTPPPKKPAAPKKVGKPGAPAAKKGATKKPAPKTPKTTPTKWRVVSSPAPAPEPPNDVPCEPGRELMVIPQPEPLSPWKQFKADLPQSFDEFLDGVEEGENLKEFCERKGIPRSTFRTWLDTSPEHSAMYARGKQRRADKMFEDMIAIADETEVVAQFKGDKVVLALDATAVNRNKLRVDTRKFAVARLRPDVYGDKVQIEQNLNARNLTDEQLLAALAGLGVAIPAIIPKGEGPSDEA